MVLGLIILVVEVRQTAALTRMELEAEFVFSSQSVESHRLDPEMARVWVKALKHPKQLEPFEVTMLDSLLALQLQNWWLLLQMSQSDLVSLERVKRAVTNEAPYFFGNEFAQKWWSIEGNNGWKGTGFWEIVDPLIRQQQPDFNANRLDVLLPIEEHN